MYKITMFIDTSIEELGRELVKIRFRPCKGTKGWEFTMKDIYFRIEPLKTQGYNSEIGIRIYSNGSIDGILHLFETSLVWTNPIITGVEIILEGIKNAADWLRDIRRLKSFKSVLTELHRGIFRKDNTSLVFVSDIATLQIRGKKLNLRDCLREVSSIRDEILPNPIDLFSFAETM